MRSSLARELAHGLRRGLVLGAASASAIVAACEKPGSDLCDPGQVLDPKTGYCFAAPKADAGSDGATPQASEGGMSEASDGASCSAGTSQFGDPCMSTTDCHCPTDYCAQMPGAASGTCTRTGCDVDPAICPSGFTCLDLSQFAAGLPHICYK